MHRHKPILKQSNNFFKGKSSIRKKSSQRLRKCNESSFLKPLSGKNRENQKNQLRKNKIISNNLRKEEKACQLGTPILCTIIPFNSYCDPISVVKVLSNYIYLHYPGNSESEIHFQNNSNSVFTFNIGKHKLSICIAEYNKIFDTLDLIKCSDFIIALFGFNDEFQAFDEIGYKLLKSIKLQGQTDTIGLFFHNGSHNFGNKILDCEKVFKKSFEMEFEKNMKFFSLQKENDIRNLLSSIPNMGYSKICLREGRGYMLSESSSIVVNNYSNEEKRQLVIRGFVRGIGLSMNFPVHITNIGDFVIDEIRPIDDPLYRSSTPPSSHNEFIPSGLKNNEILDKELVGIIGMENSISLDDSSHENFGKYGESMHIDTPNNLSANGIEHYEDNLDLESEIDSMHEILTDESEDESEISSDEKRVEIETICRTRFKKYRGLESLRTSNWDPFENLPSEYSKIFEIDSFKKTGEISRKIYVDNCNQENFKGKYCEIKLSPVSSEAQRALKDKNVSNRIIILSSILPFERKVGVMNFRIKRTAENNDLIKNKTPLVLQAGFRRFYICPIVSNCPRISSATKIERTQILKQCKVLLHGDYYIISCYSTIVFPPCPILLFSLHDINSNYQNKITYKNFKPGNFTLNDWPLAWGDVLDADPYRVIVKRIVLVGNLFKVRKSKAVVRNMFNNPEDVKWFKSVGLRTRSGIRGIIREPLGMHGYMKCLFSRPIQQNEVVGMPLYKRVFPKWFPITWFEDNNIRIN
ncbi:ENSANGP00000018078 [Cryptosporidium hominis TU502]|uniref:ENSANGP00000018078 n=1 Tax=Cryptosporidium hominis (strain TU502) TaxID=353151 RepID=UPI0000452FD8|nr:ENSANGP00000018078 [Cryptosporidium hominis TU502]